MARIPTVRVETENEQGFKIINECDFDESEHVLFEEKPAVTGFSDEELLANIDALKADDVKRLAKLEDIAYITKDETVTAIKEKTKPEE
jgi:hypothetical protein